MTEAAAPIRPLDQGAAPLLKRVAALAPGPWVGRVAEVAFNALAALLLFACIGAIAIVVERGADNPLLFAGGIGAALALGAALVSLAGLSAELMGQRARDLEAQAIYDALRDGREAQPFSLYLRPFLSTGAFSERETVAATGALQGLGLAGVTFELEAQVERAARRIGKLIGLGASLEHIGAGRVVVSEEEWRQAVRLLMRKARLIVMLPSSRPGTLAEIDMVLSDPELVGKTVFLDPPNLADSPYDHHGEWTAVQAAFAAQGFSLPPEHRGGLLLHYGRSKTPELKERLEIDADDRIERLFNRVLKRLGAPAPQSGGKS